MQHDLYDGLTSQVVEATHVALTQWQQTPAQVLKYGLVAGTNLVSADRYCRDAAVAVEAARTLVQAMRQRQSADSS